ncbi:MAG: pyruvate dehydrogenase (acetyl-transferring) E1 component subunit alpha [Sphingobacteriia bacterium]|nr:pyruvate dehydrogenase (acetyl-transferring) E1 component subunit alpha [Sphingobacteriia bacterium]
MLLQRRFEEKCKQLYGMQKINGFLHLYIGQEAISSGIESAIRKDDYVITAYRDHGNAIVRGIDPKEVMAELYGKRTGCSRGKGGSMHMFSKEHNFLGGHGIVGGQIPLGAGVGFAIQYRGEDKLCVVLMGDGAVRQGALHEAFNLAMTWKLPVLFICENNMYAMGTSVERTSNVTDIYKLGAAYDMPSRPVDGMNIMTVYEEIKKAAEHIRSGKGPVFLELKTYRYQGHSISDPGKYRTKEEVDQFKEQDPILILKSYMMEHNLLTEEGYEEIEARVKEQVQACVDFAESSPFPDPAELYEDVYVENDYPFIKD